MGVFGKARILFGLGVLGGVCVWVQVSGVVTEVIYFDAQVVGGAKSGPKTAGRSPTVGACVLVYENGQKWGVLEKRGFGHRNWGWTVK